jgi:hypothetical protein
MRGGGIMKMFRTSSLPLLALSFVIPMIGGKAARMLAGTGYHAITDEDPPKNPAHPDVEWKEAVVWTVVSAVIGGLARLMLRRWLATTTLPAEGLDYNADRN